MSLQSRQPLNTTFIQQWHLVTPQRVDIGEVDDEGAHLSMVVGILVCLNRENAQLEFQLASELSRKLRAKHKMKRAAIDWRDKRKPRLVGCEKPQSGDAKDDVLIRNPSLYSPISFKHFWDAFYGRAGRPSRHVWPSAGKSCFSVIFNEVL